MSIENNIVSHVTSYKCLGNLLDEKLTFRTHIEYTCNKTLWERTLRRCGCGLMVNGEE